MTNKTKTPVNLWESLLIIAFLAITLFLSIAKYDSDARIPVIAAIILLSLLAVKKGFTWAEIQHSIVETIKESLPALIILMIIGLLIASWIASGTVPTMIFYGLKILSPKIFLAAGFVLCSIISTAIGSSWTTVGTIGIVFVAIGQSMGIPLPVTAGAVISGAYVGDKISPVSDTTNVAAAAANVNLFVHIRHMLKTTWIAYSITLIAFLALSMKYQATVDYEKISEITNAINNSFTISPILLLPPALLIYLSIKKKPAIPTLIFGTALGCVLAVIYQHTGVKELFSALYGGYVATTQNGFVNELLSRGGIDSMMWTVSLIFCTMSFGGVARASGMLKSLSDAVLKISQKASSIVASSVLTGVAFNFLLSDQYLSVILTGNMYRDIYKEKRIKLENLSRASEDGGTVTSCLVPWNTCGAFCMGVLGISPFVYLPYAFFNILTVVVAVALAKTRASSITYYDDAKEK